MTSENIASMSYEEYVIDVFREDQSAYGLCEEEISDILEETPFKKIERWLSKRYDIRDMYANDYQG
jgi:hypothetical protein